MPKLYLPLLWSQEMPKLFIVDGLQHLGVFEVVLRLPFNFVVLKNQYWGYRLTRVFYYA